MENGYIFIENSVFPTLFAISENEQSRGLMWEEWPPPIMSFVYAYPKNNRFWMKNTPSPLDIIFSNDGVITQVCKGVPFSTEIIGDDSFSNLIVELPFGTALNSGIKVGNKIGVITPAPEVLKKIIAQKYHNFAELPLLK